jgi:hypothetical protein
MWCSAEKVALNCMCTAAAHVYISADTFAGDLLLLCWQVAHPDLAANIWRNLVEIAGNGLDDDGNGRINDINGWDFVSNDASVYDGSAGSNVDAHGTHCAGTIGEARESPSMFSCCFPFFHLS